MDSSNTNSKYVILIIEDNEMNRDILVRRLQKLGYQTRTAVDGPSGLQATQGEKPDLVIMDINLPGMDGTEVTRRLREDVRTKDIPIIAVTAHAKAEEREAIMGSGCDEFETKPINFSALSAKISSLLERNQK